MISYQMNAYSLDVISYTCNSFLRCSVYLSCLAPEISRYMTEGEHKVAYFDFKESSYRFVFLILRNPFTDLHICISTYQELCGAGCACHYVVILARNRQTELLL